MKSKKSISALLNKVLHTKKRPSDHAVSEIVGTLLLIGIGISLVVALAIVTFSISYAFFSPTTPSVNIIGTVIGNSVILEHHGGDPISIDSIIHLNFAETPYTTTVGNALDSSAKADGYWNIGERIVIPYSGGDLSGMQVSITIIDKNSNSIILRGIIQSGSNSVLPQVITLNADSITSYSAILHMYFDFKGHTITRNVAFLYIPSSVYQSNHSAIWSSTGWIPVAVNDGQYNCTLSGLNQNVQYLFQASIQYNKTKNITNKIIVNGSINSFSTPSTAVGIWHFDEPSGMVAIDSSPYGNNGVLYPSDANISPQRISNHVVNNKSLFFDGIDDYVKINSSASLNITNQIAIETWVKPDIETQLMGSNLKRIDTTVFRNRNYSCYDPDIIKVSDHIFAVVSRNSSNKGYVTTVNISSDGDIIENATTSIVDLFYFEKSNCEKPRIIKVVGSNNIYAIVYRGQNGKLNVTTLAISPNGSINKLLISKLSIDGNSSYTPKIIYVTGQLYVVVYTVWQNYLGINRYVGKLRVINITSTGIISKQQYYDFGSSGLIYGVMQYPDIIHIADENYSMVFQDSDLDGAIRGVQILPDGTILPQASNDKFDNDNISNTPLKILQVYNNIYAILYGDKIGNILNGGVVATVTINPDGTLNTTINNVVITAPAEVNSFFDPDFIHINGSIFAVVYDYGNLYGYVKTIEINNTGNINTHSTDPLWKLQFDYVSTSGVFYPRIIQTNATTHKFAIVYLKKTTATDYNDGAMVTIEISNSGPITQKLFDSVFLGAVNFFMPSVCHVAGNIYALVALQWPNYPSDTNITIRTFSISQAGVIGKYCIDSKTFSLKNITINAYAGTAINIAQINQNIYAIIFSGYIKPSYIRSICLLTINIANNGTIVKNILNSLNITYVVGYNNYCTPCLTHVTGNIFAVSYHMANATKSKFLSTIQITPTGNITYIDTFSYNGYVPIGTTEENSEIMPINGNNHVVAVLYCYDYNPGAAHKGLAILMTIYIDSSGHINQTPLKIFSFDSYGCSRPNMIHMSGTNYAIVYSNCVYVAAVNRYYTYGYIRTVNISSNGTFLKNIDYAVFNLTIATSDVTTFQTITNVYQNVYTIAYSVPNTPITYPPRGYIGTLRIATNGKIGRTAQNTVFDTQFSLFSKNCTSYPLSFNISGNCIAVIYRGSYEDGYIETINMTIVPFKSLTRTIFSKQNAYAITANDTKVFATLVTTGGNRTLNLPIHNGWNYIVLSYNQSKMKLYNNVTQNTSLSLNLNVKTSSSQLIFGGFSGTYDEFILHNSALTDNIIWTTFKQYTPT